MSSPQQKKPVNQPFSMAPNSPTYDTDFPPLSKNPAVKNLRHQHTVPSKKVSFKEAANQTILYQRDEMTDAGTQEAAGDTADLHEVRMLPKGLGNFLLMMLTNPDLFKCELIE